MENQTYSQHALLLLEGLKVNHQSSYPAFVLLLIIYIFTVVSNFSLLILVLTERSLHQPMYILFCNLPVNDVFGATHIVPLLSDLFVASADRYISYIDCVTQAFSAHLFAANCHTILIIMAFDRYVAICNPLHYATIMNNRMVVKLTASAWGVALVLVGILLGLTIRLSRCRRVIMNPLCDNASLFKLSCESIAINNIYGLTFTVVLLGSSIGSVTLTYLRITMVCVKSKSKVLNTRALQTCSTHLAVYVIMLVSGFTIIFLHRFPQWSDYRKLAAIMFHVVPPALNPIIYGLQSKEIRQIIYKIFHNDKKMRVGVGGN